MHFSLYALVLVPLVAMSALAVSTNATRWQILRRAQGLQPHVQRLHRLALLGNAVAAEELPAQTQASGAKLRISPTVASLLLGDDLPTKIADSRRATDTAAAGFEFDPTIARQLLSLPSIRDRFDRGELTERQVSSGYQHILNAISRELRQESTAVNAIELDDRSGLLRDLRFLTLSLRLANTAGEENRALFGLLDPNHNSATLRRVLAGSRALDLSDLEEMGAIADSEFSPIVRRLRNQARYGEYFRLVELLLSGSTLEPAATSPLRIAGVVRTGRERTAEMVVLSELAGQRGETSAGELRNAATYRLRTSMLFTCAAGLLSLVAAAFVARRTSAPMNELSIRATAIVEGDLGGPPLEPRGPRELTEVTAAMNELVANLHSVETYAISLARGALDDRSLQISLRGRLGHSLNAAMERLTESIRERQELQQELTHQATHDSLTLLPNRVAAFLGLEQAIRRTLRGNVQLATLFVDLDNFKQANDDFGHGIGDEVLRRVAATILETVREGDLVARLGGDEFLVIAEQVNGTTETTQLGERIIAAIERPLRIEDATIRISASVGVALLSGHTEDAAELLRRADAAMYEAKKQGRGRVILFDAEMERSQLERSQLERSFVDALVADQLDLHYQPIVASLSGHVAGYEALVRWHRPGYGDQAPSKFIPLLETTSAIIELGRWVLSRAASELPDLCAQSGREDLWVAVNLSAHHVLSPHVVADVRRAIVASGIRPACLHIEITETALVTDLSLMSARLRDLRALGVCVAIDDFGTGFTSIHQLSRLAVDVLKIDRSFVERVANVADRRIIELIIELGHTLGMTVVAEGIESAEQRQALTDLNCDLLQGYHLGRPAARSQIQGNIDRDEFHAKEPHHVSISLAQS